MLNIFASLNYIVVPVVLIVGSYLPENISSGEHSSEGVVEKFKNQILLRFIEIIWNLIEMKSCFSEM